MIGLIAGVLPFAGAIIISILRRWQFGIVILFVWLFIGDSIRKLIPGQPAFIILIGDVILFITYFSFFAFNVIKKKPWWLPPFFLALLFFSFLALVGMFNPGISDITIGLVGLRSYLWFISLMFLGYAYFRNTAHILHFALKIVYLAIPLFLFAIIQLSLPNIDSPFFTPFEGGWRVHSFGIYGFGFIPKIPSFFGSDQRYGMVSMILFFLSLGLFYSKKTMTISNNRPLLFTALVSAFGGTIICGSRSAFVLTLIGLILFFFIKNREQIKINSRRVMKNFTFAKILFLVLFVLGLLYGLYRIGIAVGISNILAIANVFNSRLPEYISELKKISPQITLFGHGVGLLSQGLTEIGVFKGDILKFAYSGAETGTRRVIVELGIVGFILFLFLWVHIFVAMSKRLKTMQNSDMFPLGLGILIFPILILIRFLFVHHQVLGDWAVLILLWFFIGVFFKLVRLEIG